MNFFHMLPGRFTLELTSADPEEALRIITGSGISISGIQKVSDLTFHCRISRKDYFLLTAICKKQGYSLKILAKSGPYWMVKHALLRPVLLVGLIFLFLAVLLLPTRVLFIRVEGNRNVPSKQILSAAQDCGVSFFASRRAVRSEKVKNALLYRLPELEWVGVNTSGCTATISVRERMTEAQPETKGMVSSIVADRDAFLLSVTVTSGNPLCQAGQYVTEGQLLVSGYRDCGIFIQATPSEAEILAQTTRHLEVIRSSKPLFRGKKRNVKHKYSLLVGKKRINLWKDSGIWDTTCGRIYEEKYFTLPGGFQLPLAMCIEEYIFYDTQFHSDGEGTQAAMSLFAEDYLCRHMTAGTILSREEAFSATGDTIHMVGSYTCQEMIGRVKLGEYHG